MKISVNPYLSLEVLEQVEHLGLDADVERRHRLVADDQRRVEHERAGDRDALALAAAELVRTALGGASGVDADGLEHLVDHARSRSADVPRCQISSGSLTLSRTMRRGLSDEIGSWKIIWIRVRAERSSACATAR